MCATFGSDLRTCSLIAWRALWILPSCTAFCTACDGATASTSALSVCEETPCGRLPRPGVCGGGGGGTLVEGPCVVCGDGIVGRGGGGGEGGGPVGRGAVEVAIRTGRLLSTTFLYFDTLRNSSCAT